MDKKGIVNLTTFSFIIFLLLSLFFLSFGIYTYSKETYDKDYAKLNCNSESLSFRSMLIETIQNPNTTLTYSRVSVSYDLELVLVNDTISCLFLADTYKSEHNISNFNIKFCDEYSFYPKVGAEFFFNGSCISKLE